MWLTKCNRKSTAKCDICKEKINFKEGCYNCRICFYDECSKCSGYYKIKEQREKAKKLALGLKVEDGEEGQTIAADKLLEKIDENAEKKKAEGEPIMTEIKSEDKPVAVEDKEQIKDV